MVTNPVFVGLGNKINTFWFISLLKLKVAIKDWATTKLSIEIVSLLDVLDCLKANCVIVVPGSSSSVPVTDVSVSSFALIHSCAILDP